MFCQIGYETREPVHVGHARMVPIGHLTQMIDAASLVVSHGGPGSIMPVFASGRPLVLVPRQHRFGEHVDDHQVDFCRRVAARRGLTCVEDIATLGDAIDAAFAGGTAGMRAQEGPPAGVHELALRVDAILRGGR